MPPAVIAAGAGLAGSIIAGKSENKGISGLAPAILQGGAGLAGSFLQSGAAKDAAKSQERSTAEALDFERDREMRRRMEFDQAREDRMKAHEAQERAFEPYRLAAAGVLKKYIPNYDFERMNAPPEIQTAAPPPEEDPYTLGMLARGR